MATTKLDLDELERKAKAATPGQWQSRVPGRDCIDAVLVENEDGRQIADTYDNTPWPEQECVANGDHIAANSPPVTLALIAYIRDLERLAANCQGVLERDGFPEYATQIREFLGKGVVLP